MLNTIFFKLLYTSQGTLHFKKQIVQTFYELRAELPGVTKLLRQTLSEW